MSVQPFISVIVPTRDRPSPLAGCLNSLKANDYAQREIVVVDQSASEKTATVVRQAAVGDPSLRYIHSDKTGSSHAHNIALELAQGEVVAITNDDCCVAPNWLTRLAEEFVSNPDVVAVFGPFLPLGLSRQTFAVAALTGRRRRIQQGPQEVWRLGYGGNMAFRLQAVIEAGGWDKMMGPGSPHRWGCNDVDLIYRVLRRGGLSIYAPDIIVWHAQQFGLSQALRREANYARGAGALFAKLLRCGDRDAWRLLAQRMWPVGPGRTWHELIETMGGGNGWTLAVRALFRVYCMAILIPWGAISSYAQPVLDIDHMLYQSNRICVKGQPDVAQD